MSFFTKSVTDEEWVSEARPLCTTAMAQYDHLTVEYANYLRKTSKVSIVIPGVEGPLRRATSQALGQLSAILNSIHALPRPTSLEAREAAKDLLKAVRKYKHTAELAQQLINLVDNGVLARALQPWRLTGAGARLRMVQNIQRFDWTVSEASEAMQRAGAYLHIQVTEQGMDLDYTVFQS